MHRTVRDGKLPVAATTQSTGYFQVLGLLAYRSVCRQNKEKKRFRSSSLPFPKDDALTIHERRLRIDRASSPAPASLPVRSMSEHRARKMCVSTNRLWLCLQDALKDALLEKSELQSFAASDHNDLSACCNIVLTIVHCAHISYIHG
ncbi:uncharacterized protein [Zea mays]|uniref:uncharacterized protein isoform X2 n=1 Tax=Zea mays TaxID=4577 RepID=UPI0009A9BEB9|nr:uncharacterized protein LOC100275099 isoform X2 [Zea mays]|eukprot:XP_020395248.1 uncharacterized protein LOC109939180 isoform X2 [Zea mays]